MDPLISQNGGEKSRRVHWYCSITGRVTQGGKTNDTPLENVRRCGKLSKPKQPENTCPWIFGVKLKDGLWEVCNVCTKHDNHAAPSTRVKNHLKGGIHGEDMDEGLLKQLTLLCTSGVVPSRICTELMNDPAWADSGITLERVENYKASLSSPKGVGDAQHLVDKIRLKQKEDMRWVLDYQLDEAGRLLNVFWMSPDQVDKAQRYHYVLLHDNTYNSNRYRLALSLFASVDKYLKTILLAQGLMPEHEDAKDYTWHYQTYLKHVGYAPRVFFSDAALAVLAAVPDCFPQETLHLLCLFHILTNIVKNLKGVLQEDQWETLLGDVCEVHAQTDEEVAKLLWDALLAKYPEGKPYLSKQLGDKLHMWVVAWHVHVFTAGMVATQRSESLNKRAKAWMSGRRGLCTLFEALISLLQRQAMVLEECELEGEMATFRDQALSRLTSVYHMLQDVLTPPALKKVVAQMAISITYDVTIYTPEAENMEMANAKALGTSGLFRSGRRNVHPKEGSCVQTLQFTDLPRLTSIQRWIQANVVGQLYATFAIKKSRVSQVDPTKAGAPPQYLVLYQPQDNVYTNFYCTCGYSVRFGHPCRHYWAVLFAQSDMVGFHTGLLHPSWFAGDYPIAQPLLIHGRDGTSMQVVPQQPIPAPLTVEDIEYAAMEVGDMDDDQVSALQVTKQKRKASSALWSLLKKVHTTAENSDTVEEDMASLKQWIASRDLKQSQAANPVPLSIQNPEVPKRKPKNNFGIPPAKKSAKRGAKKAAKQATVVLPLPPTMGTMPQLPNQASFGQQPLMPLSGQYGPTPPWSSLSQGIGTQFAWPMPMNMGSLCPYQPPP
jgi:predicted XRE-type DNA-binding protein